MTSTIIRRDEKGTKLTYAEGDANWEHIRRLFRLTEDSPAITGTADALVATSPVTSVPALVDGLTLLIVPTATNTGAVTINVDSRGAKSLLRQDGTALTAGILVAGRPFLIRYNLSADNFRLLSLSHKAEIGLGNVDNTADADKPISTATQAALDGKAASSHSHVISDVTNLQTTLDGKAASSHNHAASNITSGTLGVARIPAANNSGSAGTGFGGFRYTISGTTLNLFTT